MGCRFPLCIGSRYYSLVSWPFDKLQQETDRYRNRSGHKFWGPVMSRSAIQKCWKGTLAKERGKAVEMTVSLWFPFLFRLLLLQNIKVIYLDLDWHSVWVEQVGDKAFLCQKKATTSVCLGINMGPRETWVFELNRSFSIEREAETSDKSNVVTHTKKMKGKGGRCTRYRSILILCPFECASRLGISVAVDAIHFVSFSQKSKVFFSFFSFLVSSTRKAAILLVNCFTERENFTELFCFFSGTVWVAAVALFFHRWGKIRMLLPYQPVFKGRYFRVCQSVFP